MRRVPLFLLFLVLAGCASQPSQPAVQAPAGKPEDHYAKPQ